MKNVPRFIFIINANAYRIWNRCLGRLELNTGMIPVGAIMLGVLMSGCIPLAIAGDVTTHGGVSTEFARNHDLNFTEPGGAGGIPGIKVLYK